MPVQAWIWGGMERGVLCHHFSYVLRQPAWIALPAMELLVNHRIHNLHTDTKVDQHL